ncbi:MAG TPA: DUF1292 domain-containing protein [Pseudogracilibacillus sp.]|nr:DUF1292 domain-containing protein [Pseudogracilibacillus sp.]
MGQEEQNERIIIPDENGEEHLFETVFTFDVDETGHSYICLVPVEQLEQDEAEIYAFRFEEDKSKGEDGLSLFPIESDDEWDMVEEMINTLAEENGL